MKICSFEECSRVVLSRGLCRQHYNQWRHKGVLTPIRQYNREVDGKKRCPDCGVTKPISEYYTWGDDQRSRCILCSKANATERRREDARLAAEYRALLANKNKVDAGTENKSEAL